MRRAWPAVLKAGLRLVGALPLPLLHALGAALGALLWAVPNRIHKDTLFHLRLCQPQRTESERRRLARASLAHMGRALAEAPAIWFGPRRRLARWLDDGPTRARLRELAAERGLILLCPHLGAWELSGMLCAAAGPMTSLYKPQKGAGDALVLEGRARLGAQLAPSTIHGVKALLAALKRHEMIGILPDQYPPWGSGTFAPLFGIQAHTTELVTKLAARSGAPVWFIIAERLPRGRGFRFHLSPAPADIADPKLGAAALNRGIEQVVLSRPDQYWWAYRRYRRRPEGEPRIYPKGQ